MYRTLALVVLLTLNLTVAFARDESDTATTYRCTTKDAVSVLRDGTLNKLVGEAALKFFDKIVIDVSNGHITYPSSGTREEWVVEKITVTGSDKDYVLYPSSSSRMGHTVANGVSHFIRLRAAANEPQPRFIAFTLSYLVSGTCELLPPLFAK
jgi:hypothetical protein